MSERQATRALVRRMVRAGMADHQIAFKLGITLETLRAVFGEEMERERAAGARAAVRVVVRLESGEILYES